MHQPNGGGGIRSNGAIVSRFKCRMDGCNWKAQIHRQVESYQVFIRPKFNRHNHRIMTKAQEPLQQHGMHTVITGLVVKYIADEEHRGQNVTRITAHSILKWVVKPKKESTEHSRYQYLVEDGDLLDRLTTQIRSKVNNLSHQFVTDVIGTSNIRNNDELVAVLKRWKLIKPSGYVSRSIYSNSGEVAASLGVAPETMFICDLTHGAVTRRYIKHVVKLSPAARRDFHVKIEQAFIAISPHGLFQLLSLAKRVVGTIHGCADGTGGNNQNHSWVLGSFWSKFC